MKSLLIQFVLLMIPLLALGLPYDSIEDLYSPEYDYDEDNEVSEEGDVMKAPGFVSETMNLVVNEGETIRLPCIVTRLQGFVLLWKKNDNIITVGDQILGNADSRYYLEAKENGNNLMIRLAEPGDEGEFVCQVSAFKPTQIHHSVKIRVRPSIQTSPVKTLTVKEGEEARLYCRVVAGNPKPKLKWRRKGGIMPTGDEEIMGEVIIFESVTRHYEGTYECVTEDDYGFEPITREVQLHVEYAPVIEQEQTYIKTEAGEEIHVTCVVHAYPEPEVEWEKDGQPIDGHSNGFVINRSGDRHNLILLVVKKEFFGDYSCRASNELGVATKSAHVSGDYGSYSRLSSVKPQTYSKLDIRNFYLETLGDSDFIAFTQEHESPKQKEEIENLKGLRIFSYWKQLRNRKNPEGVKKFHSATYLEKIDESQESVDDNQEVNKVTQSLGVTDMTDKKDMTKSFRGSFSDTSDLNEIENIQEIRKITENTEKNPVDIGWGWYSKETYPDFVKSDHTSVSYKYTGVGDGHTTNTQVEENEVDYDNEEDSLKDVEKMEDSTLNSAVQPTSAELTNSYRGSFSQNSDLDEIDNLEDEEKAHISDDNTLVDATGRYYSSPRYLDISESFDFEDQSNYDRSNLAFHQEKDNIEQTSIRKLTNSYRGSISERDDLEEIAALENVNDMQIEEELEQLHKEEKHHSSPRYLDFSGEGSLEHTAEALADAEDRDMDEESSGEGGEVFDETATILYSQDNEKHIEGNFDKAKDEKPAEGDGFSFEESYTEMIEDPESNQQPVSGDMYLTTSIVTEHIGETNLENKSPYEKPYIITQLPKEHIQSGKRKYSNVEEAEHEEETTGGTNMIENIRPYPIYIKQTEDDMEVKDYEDEPQMVPLLFPQDKQTVQETTGYQHESISPPIIYFTQGSHRIVNEQSEASESVGELIDPVITQMKVDASQYKQTYAEEKTKHKDETEHTKEFNISEQVEDEYETKTAEDEIVIATEGVLGHEASDEHTSSVRTKEELSQTNKISSDSVDFDENTNENLEITEKIRKHNTVILSVTNDDDQGEYEEEQELKHSQGQGTVFESIDKSDHMEIIEDSLDTKEQTKIIGDFGETEMEGKVEVESENTSTEEPGEPEVAIEKNEDSVETEVHIERVGESEETEIAKQDEYDDDEYIYEENMEYEEKKSIIELEQTTETEDEAEEEVGNRKDTKNENTELQVDNTDKSEVSENEYEAVENAWEEESEDGHEFNPNVLITKTETEQPDYVDYSYAELAARTKTTEITIVANESFSEYENYMKTLDEPNMESEKEQHDYEHHTSVSENKIEEITDPDTDSGQYVNFQKKLRKELGYAEEAKIQKSPLKSSPQSLQIEWTAQSETPLTIFRVQFMANDSTDWSEVDVTASKLENDDWYGKANLMNLQPNTEYMVKVSSMNNEGYSQFSGVQLFATPAKGQVKQEAISSSSSAQITVNLLLYLIPLMSSLISGKVFIK